MTEPVEIFVLDKRVKLLQPAAGFRTSLDSVMVAAACPAASGDTVLDLGCGVGGAAFCLLDRIPNCHVTGIDIQHAYIDLAQQNIALNKKENQTQFLLCNIRTARPETLGQRFDHVICNPPYLEAGTYTPSPDQGRATALGHTEEETGLEDWTDAAFHNLKSGGSLTLIHRADMTDRIIRALGKRFGGIEIIPLWPRAGEAAKRVILRARKDRKSPATLWPGLVLHEENGSYTPETESILRGGNKLFLD